MRNIAQCELIKCSDRDPELRAWISKSTLLIAKRDCVCGSFAAKAREVFPSPTYVSKDKELGSLHLHNDRACSGSHNYHNSAELAPKEYCTVIWAYCTQTPNMTCDAGKKFVWRHSCRVS